MAENKRSFVLYADLIHTVRKMPKNKQAELFMTILQYVNDENPVVTDLMVDIAFEPIKQQLKRDLKRWEEFRQKQAENGAKGGRPKKTTDTENIPENPSLLDETQKSLNVTVNATVTDNVISNNSSAANAAHTEKEKRPTLEDVTDYMSERLDDFSAQAEARKFFNFYESKGWKVGKNPMVKWKAAVANWLSNKNAINGTGNTKAGQSNYGKSSGAIKLAHSLAADIQNFNAG